MSSTMSTNERHHHHHYLGWCRWSHLTCTLVVTSVVCIASSMQLSTTTPTTTPPPPPTTTIPSLATSTPDSFINRSKTPTITTHSTSEQSKQQQQPQYTPLTLTSTGEFSIENGTRLELYNIHRNPPDEPPLTLRIGELSSTFIHQVTVKTHLIRTIHLTDDSTIDFTLENIEPNLRRFHFEWNLKNLGTNQVCIEFGQSAPNWYSTYQSLHIQWPLNKHSSLRRDRQQFNCLNQAQSRQDEFQNLLEHLFVNTDGFAVWFDSQAPLFIERKLNKNNNQDQLCFSVRSEYPYSTRSKIETLVFTVFAGINIRSVTQHVVHHSGLLPVPESLPDEHKFIYPNWSTWPRYDSITQPEVIRYAQKLERFGLPHGELQLVSSWRTDPYRELRFDHDQFPNPRRMTSELHSRGFRFSVSINPSVNDGSTLIQKYFFRVGKRLSQANLTKADAREWFSDLLTATRARYDFDSFVVTPYMNPCERFPSGPNRNVVHYLETITQSSAGNQSSSMWAFRSQRLPLFTQLFLQGSSHAELLRLLIPNVLSASLGGYSFVSGFPIGYPSYQAQKPSAELYIRWVQATALLPAMTFTVPPWAYANQTVHQLTRKYVNFHIQHAPILINLAKRRVATGDPIIRPLWYGHPDDPNTYAIDDQFMVGEDILVAPVLREGQYRRSVYLPVGRWLDQHGNEYNGSTEVIVPAPLAELPYFIRPCGSQIAKNLAGAASIDRIRYSSTFSTSGRSLTDRWRGLVELLQQKRRHLTQKVSARDLTSHSGPIPTIEVSQTQLAAICLL